MKNKKIIVLVILMVHLFCFFAKAQTSKDNDLPLIGAQVFIEPGQTDGEIENWFRVLKDNNLKVCRIRMFEIYMHKTDGSWDYSLFDKAFKAAEKYNIKIFATIFPSAKDNSVGGCKFPQSEQHFKEIADYIQHLVTHFKQFNSLYGWVLLNEPGTGGFIPKDEFTRLKFEEWKNKQATPEYKSKGYNTALANFDREKFLIDYNTWFLGWIAGEVHKYDPGRHLHVNNHQIFENIAEYKFTEWRKFLTSLGASAHPSWHFGYFKRNQYTLAMSANCDIIRSGAGTLPFWITELQGGNVTYSAPKAFCPTKEEITQWLWTGIGAGAKGVIFWCLNPRSIGDEAGEWALLDFQKQPSDRLMGASAVSSCLEKNNILFSNAHPLETGINILYIREALWVEKKVQANIAGEEKNYEGHMIGGVMKSALAYYQALAENGINSNLKEIEEFDWSRKDYKGITVILANQVSIPSIYWTNLEDFVSKGGKLIIDGLTAFYDENMLSLANTGFPLEKLLGGTLSEIKCIPGDFEIKLDEPNLNMPAHLWKGYIKNITGTPIAKENNQVLAIRNTFGKGETVWVPSLIGMGAWRNDNSKLSAFLMQEVSRSIDRLPIHFKAQKQGVLMRTMQSGNSLITIIINKTSDTQIVDIAESGKLKPNVLFANKTGSITGSKVIIASEETLVVEWNRLH